MDKARFQAACEKANTAELSQGGIGTLAERTLHRTLKHYFEPDPSHHEVKIGGFVADIAGPDGIIEIQTRDLGKLRKKLDCFLAAGSVTVVYPVAAIKRLQWIDIDTGELGSARKSPKKGGLHDALPELYKIRSYLTHPNFKLCIVLLELMELRYLNGWSRDKKRGSHRSDRIPHDLLEEVYFKTPDHYRKMLPADLQAPFYAKDFMRATKMSRYQASLGIGTLKAIGAIRVTAKEKNAFLYE